MAFKFRRGSEDVEVTSKDIIGLTEDEVKEKFGKIENLETTVKTQGEETKTTLDAIKSTLAALEGKITSTRRQDSNDGDNQDERTPEQKVQDFTLQTSLETKMLVVKSDVKNKQDKDGNLANAYWDEFSNEIDELTKTDPLMTKTQAAYWQNAYDIVVGRHVTDISSGKIKSRRRMFVEGGGDSNRTTQTTNVDEPSELDKTQAAKFHIDINKYMEQKKKMVFVK